MANNIRDRNNGIMECWKKKNVTSCELRVTNSSVIKGIGCKR
jgi:hypothetical protein